MEAEIDGSKWTQSHHNQLTLFGQEEGSNNLPLIELPENNQQEDQDLNNHRETFGPKDEPLHPR
jgi:hypothetical protein